MAMHNSIIRRSLAVMVFHVAGHGFNYLLLATTNRMLAPELFGLFYLSISLINVLGTPGLVLAMSLAQRFAGLSLAKGSDAVIHDLNRTLLFYVKWGGAAALVGAVALAVAGRFLGVESFAIVILIPAVAYAEVMFEIIRACLQGLQRFTWFGVSWVIRCIAQYAFAVAALYLFHSVWAGLSGFLIATALMNLGVRSILPARPSGPVGGQGRDDAQLPWGAALLPQVSAYGLFTLLANLDVLLGYLLLSHEQLGVYAASSILPKAIVTVTLPVAQVLLPVVAVRYQAGESARLAIVKAVTTVFVLSSCGALVLWLGSDLACGSRFGIRFCEPPLMALLAAAAVPLAVMRVLVVTSLALKFTRRAMLQVWAVGLMVVLSLFATQGDLYRLAVIYLVVCAGTMFVYFGIELWSRPRLARFWVQTPT